MDQSRNDQESAARKNHRENVKKFLERTFDLNAGIQSAWEQIQEYQSRSYRLSSPSDFSAPRVQRSPSPEASFVDVVEKKTDFEAKMIKTLDELNARKNQIVSLINEYTEGRENRILTLRYILGWRWEDIATELHFSKPHVFLLLNNALDKIVLLEDAPRSFKQGE
jgi:DNA-directed RNA polymerase specialized sigma subunit